MKFLILCIATIQCILCVACAASQNKFFIPVETIEGIKKTVVPIVCGATTQDGSFKITSTIGSAFFINNEGYFLTAGHVLDDWDKIDRSNGDCFPAVYIPKSDWQTLSVVRWFRFGNCIRPGAADVAVCKATINPFSLEDIKKKITIAFLKPNLLLVDGTPVAFTGFPLSSLRPITSMGNIASYIKMDNLIIIDKNAWPGASGSPVYLADGKVIGILIKRGINDGSGLAYAVTTESILEFLRENNILIQQDKNQQN